MNLNFSRIFIFILRNFKVVKLPFSTLKNKSAHEILELKVNELYSEMLSKCI